MPELVHTSVPGWAAMAAAEAQPDDVGRAYILVGVGDDGAALAGEWAASLANIPAVVRIAGESAAEVRDGLAAALTEATVGVRVRLAGPVGECLLLRGVAVNGGVEDDELHVAPTGSDAISVYCAHCRASTSAVAAIGDLVPCGGCGRSLVVYYHVSRRTGQFLGYMIDAEETGS